MPTDRNSARIAGILILIPFFSYGAGSGIVASIVDDPGYLGHWPNSRPWIITGALLMLINSLAVAGVGMVLYPVLKRQSLTVAAGYLGARVMEAVILVIGVISLLLLLPIGDAGLSPDAPASLKVMGDLAVKNNYFSYQVAMIVLGLGSTVFCLHMFRHRTIPRHAAVWGAVGYLLLFTGSVLELFGFHTGLLFSVPGGLFELFLAGWLIIKGFSPVVSAQW